MAGVNIERENLDTDKYKNRRHEDTGRRQPYDWCEASRNTKDCQQTPETGEEREGFSPRVFRGNMALPAPYL